MERLDEAQIQTFMESNALTEDLQRRKRYYAERPLESTIPGQVAPLVSTVLTADSTVRSVANIGSRYAIADHALASSNG